MKIAFITAQIPWGRAETFILEELLEAKRQGINLLIIPRNPPKEIFYEETEELVNSSIRLSLINWKIIISFFYSLITKLSLWRVFVDIFRHSRNLHILVKNLAVLPKGIYISKVLKRSKVEHIHVHWGGTTATMGYIVSRITNISWSITLHRWDIRQNNMLKEKVRSAKFLRCISEHGKKELLQIVSNQYKDKIEVIHMGTELSNNINQFQKEKKIFTIVTPANLLEVKGHKYLIEACLILVRRGFKNFQCIFYGEGTLRAKLESFIEKRGLTNYIKMPGLIPHEKLMEQYKNKEVDVVILPSINRNDGEHEGIPVSLMEAMAYGIPVISTNTGGISELLSDKAGIIVKEKSSIELGEAVLKIIDNRNFAKETAIKGYEKVNSEFNIRKTTQLLLEEISKGENKTG